MGASPYPLLFARALNGSSRDHPDIKVTPVCPKGKNSITRYLCKPAAEGPERGHVYEGLHAMEALDNQFNSSGLSPADDIAPVETLTGGSKDQRSLSCPVFSTVHHKSDTTCKSTSQAGSITLPPQSRELIITEDEAEVKADQ
ncbi:hypothetical protein NDU88_000336 [Pleurodeles waltl]|uniref:Prolactin receptor n=1 Tax=Pleurodeles waltl TaxID=8319 RepID=A0AAV7VWK6_PLEWA|nr:hypothetical protein NDU88_000336 [Pleurodeles waltl]